MIFPATIGACMNFVPPNFTVPATLETDEFRLRMLTIHDVVKDYDAVMSSVDHLKAVWHETTWPEGLTLEQNLIDLGWHQKEFQRKSSFAYTVVSLDEARVLGCVYIDPTKKVDHDATVCLWVRQSEVASGLDERLFTAVREWIENDWPFESAAFPGRSIPWERWNELPELR